MRETMEVIGVIALMGGGIATIVFVWTYFENFFRMRDQLQALTEKANRKRR